jgi:hypothetical protein
MIALGALASCLLASHALARGGDVGTILQSLRLETRP